MSAKTPKSNPNPRLQVPIPLETREQLQAYADATGATLTKVVVGILVETGPVMAELAEALAEVKKAPAKAMRNVRLIMDEKMADLDQIEMDIEEKPKPE